MSRLPRSAVRLTPLRAEPRREAEQVTQALAGEPLWVEEEREAWALVRTAYDYRGWIELAELADDPLAAARAFVGAPYEWGGMSERGIDCSGLVHMAYRAAGRYVPRDAHEQEAAGRALSEGELRVGDLISYGEGQADHVAFWLGDGRILHATGRDGVRAVVEETEPAGLRARRRRLFRL